MPAHSHFPSGRRLKNLERLFLERRKESELIKTLFALASLTITSTSLAMPAGSRVTLPSGKKVFVSGMNLAWISYAADVGNTPLPASSLSRIGAAMKAVHDSGGNTLRIWLSTNGTNDPIYANGTVWGPGSSTIANIQAMLQLAKANKILVLPVLLTHNWVDKSLSPSILANNKTMLTTDSGLSAYTKNYLTPVVSAIGNDPNLLGWEVFNEPEGMVDGWSSPAGTISKAQVQKAVNRIAGTIHRLVPKVLVSNGAASLSTVNWYTDANLVAAGGDTGGVLDFYMAHYYGWNGTGNSPFTKSSATWNLDKPLVIGEYASSDWSPSTASSSKLQDAGKVDTLMTYLDQAGYAGGLGWQYQSDVGDPWMKGFSTFGHSLRQAFLADSNSILLDGTGNGTFSVSVGAGAGGTVQSNPVGRIDSGKTVILKAIATAGYAFTGWTGDTTGIDTVLKIASVTKDWTILANFKPNSGTNLVKDGDFTASTSWGFYAAVGNVATSVYAGGKASIQIGQQDDTTYHIQLSQSGVPIDSGVTYILQFEASATVARSIAMGFSSGAPDWKYLGGGSAQIGTATKTIAVELVPTGSSPAAVLQFNLGGATGTLALDNVSLVKKGGVWVRPRKESSSKLSLRRVANGFVWTRSTPLPGEGALRLLDSQGRVLGQSKLAKGALTGIVSSLGVGLRFVVLQSGDESEVVAWANLP